MEVAAVLSIISSLIVILLLFLLIPFLIHGIKFFKSQNEKLQKKEIIQPTLKNSYSEHTENGHILRVIREAEDKGSFTYQCNKCENVAFIDYFKDYKCESNN